MLLCLYVNMFYVRACVRMCLLHVLCVCGRVVVFENCGNDTPSAGFEYQVLGDWWPEMSLPFQVLMELHWHRVPRYCSPAYTMLEQYLFVIKVLDLGYRAFFSVHDNGGRELGWLRLYC
jgi:hypothetical protein